MFYWFSLIYGSLAHKMIQNVKDTKYYTMKSRSVTCHLSFSFVPGSNYYQFLVFSSRSNLYLQINTVKYSFSLPHLFLFNDNILFKVLCAFFFFFSLTAFVEIVIKSILILFKNSVYIILLCVLIYLLLLNTFWNE